MKSTVGQDDVSAVCYVFGVPVPEPNPCNLSRLSRGPSQTSEGPISMKIVARAGQFAELVWLAVEMADSVTIQLHVRS